MPFELHTETIWWTLSTIAQVEAAMLAVFGVLAVWRLELLSGVKREARATLLEFRAARNLKGMMRVEDPYLMTMARDVQLEEASGAIDSREAAELRIQGERLEFAYERTLMIQQDLWRFCVVGIAVLGVSLLDLACAPILVEWPQLGIPSLGILALIVTGSLALAGKLLIVSLTNA